MKSALLMLVFNRPETTRRVFEAVRKARPPRLYIAADGARPNRTSESQACADVRNICGAVDWPCEVKTLFREANLGCKRAVSEAIGWFFDHESEGIILEDDVLPAPTFFDFCDELLERYRSDERVSMIAGCNLVAPQLRAKASYVFTRYCNIWGWATWRRAWRHYDVTMAGWPAWRDARGLATVSGGRAFFEAYWRRIFDDVHSGKIDTWDYQWTFTCWRLAGLTVLPAVNQIRNLGFDEGATHTSAGTPAYVRALRSTALAMPLVHPSIVKTDPRIDALVGARVFGLSAARAMLRTLMRISFLGGALRAGRTYLRNAAN